VLLGFAGTTERAWFPGTSGLPVRANISLPQRRRRYSFVLVLFFFIVARGQTVTPAVDYTVTIDASNLSGFNVAMSIQHAPDTL